MDRATVLLILLGTWFAAVTQLTLVKGLDDLLRLAARLFVFVAPLWLSESEAPVRGEAKSRGTTDKLWHLQRDFYNQQKPSSTVTAAGIPGRPVEGVHGSSTVVCLSSPNTSAQECTACFYQHIYVCERCLDRPTPQETNSTPAAATAATAAAQQTHTYKQHEGALASGAYR